MKYVKQFYLSNIMCIIFCSCSNNDTSSTPDVVTVREIAKTHSKGGFTSRLVYEGNKIVSEVKEDGSKVNFIYSGDFVVKIEYLDEKGVLDYFLEFTYHNGRISSSICSKDETQSKYRTVYMSNIDDDTTSNAYLIEE